MMLFNDHVEQYNIVEGEVILFSGAFLVNKDTKTSGLVIGIKQKDGQIRTRVTYHQPSANTPDVKTEKVLTPAGFEKFLNELAMSLSARTKNKLIEFNYRTRTLDDPFTAFLEDEEKELMHQLFLLNVIKEVPRTDAYRNVSHAIKQIVQERVSAPQ